MAAALLTGVNPVFGLYASFAGPIAGGLSASTRLMVITTTSAAALAAGSALAPLSAEDRPAALFLLVVIAGVLMVVAGTLRLGRYTRFVSHSVMIGFLTGVAVNIVAGQIPDLTGAEAEGNVAVAEGARRIMNPSIIHLGSLLVGLARDRDPHHRRAHAVGGFRCDRRARHPDVGGGLPRHVRGRARPDIGEIPRGIPLPQWPDLSGPRSRSSPAPWR